MIMDFCTSSILRPDVLRKCYQSFQDNLKGVDLHKCRVFLSIDPVPSSPWKHTAEQNIDVASEFFGDVVYRISDTPSLSRAVKWMWTHADTDFVFLLEDDWELFRPVDVEKILFHFKKNRLLNQFRLRWRHMSYSKGWPRHNKKYGLSPGAMRKAFYKHVAELMPTHTPSGEIKLYCPERYIRKYIPVSNRKVVYYPDLQVVKDMGGDWKKRHNFIGLHLGSKGRWQKKR